MATQPTMQAESQPKAVIARLPAPAKPVRVAAGLTTNAEPGLMTLRTQRLVLRPLTAADRRAVLRNFFAIRAHLDRFLPLGGADATPDEIFDRQLEMTVQGDATGNAFRRAAFERGTGAFVGAFNLITVRRGLEFDADLSAWLSPGFLHQGLAREGLTALFDHSFGDLPLGLGLVKIAGWVGPENAPCRKLIAELGFVRSQEASTHLSTGDHWQIHDKWELSADRWLSRPR